MRQALFFALFSLSLWADAHLFVYHRFDDTKHASTSTSLQVLKQQFEFFKQNNYEVVSLHQLSEALKKHERIPDNWVVLSIDDSYKSFYTNGLPLFIQYGYPFVLFVYIEAADKRYGDFMSWEQIREASAYGEIGLHSYGHKHMVSLSEKAIYKDTERGYMAFEKEIGHKPKYYAYPYGEFDEKVKQTVSSFDFELILNQNVGAVSGKSPRDNLDRIALTGDVDLKPKLRIKYLDAQWHSPKNYPANANLNDIHVTMPKSISTAELYVTGGEWEQITVKEGEFKSTINHSLTNPRTRVIIKAGNAYTSKIIVKEHHD